jgi:periplasmic divalent cation tolerance protein
MPEIKYVVVFVTVGNNEEARKIADILLERRKAACVNIIPGVQSSYLWKGKREASAENLLIIKTRHSVLAEVIALVKKVHSYEVPEIIAMPIIDGNRDYLKWIGDEVRV